MNRAAALLLLAGLSLAGCKREDMYTQEKSQSYDHSNFFVGGAADQEPVPGTVARDAPNPMVPQPATIDAAMLARGQERFGIFCAPCHGADGTGNGMIVQRGMAQPPSFDIPRLRTAHADHFFDVITHGKGVMYGYAERVSPADRWAVIAYIRALQLSHDAPVAALSAEDRQKLAAAR